MNVITPVIGTGNITIPLEQIPIIQSSIITTSTEAAIIFFFIGVGITAVFAYLYFRLWKKITIIDEPEDKEP